MNSFLRCSPFLLLTALAPAQNLDTVLPDPVPQQVAPVVESSVEPAPTLEDIREALAEQGNLLAARAGEEVVIDSLRAVRVLADPAELSAAPAAAEAAVTVTGVALLDAASAELLFAPFLNRPMSVESLDRMKQVLRLYFAQIGRPFSLVYTPPQDITGGVIQLVVRESVMGQVRVEGNTAFTDRSYSSRIGLRPGDPLDTARIRAGLDRINLNPFRAAAAEFAPGAEPGTADLRLRANDRLPLRLHGGFNNSGTPTTSEERLSAGVDWGNVFGTGHLASLQWTSDPDAKYSRAVSGNSVIDLPGGRNLVLFGAYSEISGKTEPEFDQEGESWQVGLNLDQTLSSASPAFTHRLTYALDFKSSDNNLDFIQPPFIIPITDNRTHVVQASAAYRGTHADALGSTGFGAKLTLSPGGIGSKNEDEAFQGSRFGADSSYVYGTIDLTRDTRLPRGFTWHVQIQGQLASTNLLGSEAMSGGGMYSVRGYEEGEVIGDNGVMLRQELRLPLLRPASQVFATSIPDALSLFVFQDAAYLWNTDKLEGEKSIDLASLGIGLQYQLGPSMTLRLAYGWQLVESGSSDSGDDSHLHFALTAGF